MTDGKQQLTITDYDPRWPDRFLDVASQLRASVGDAAVRVDHIGSTSVPGLAAKNLIDVQITVTRLAVADSWPDELIPGLIRRDVTTDHIPDGSSTESGDWEKRYWSRAGELHLHVREDGRPNQRYPLLFRDYLRADSLAARSYAAVKRALAAAAPGDWDAYYEVKDPTCDLIIAGAEHWAACTAWLPPPRDA
jgi:GrpB-like predicted nucleotidyltransferase (UPF0157 family)